MLLRSFCAKRKNNAITSFIFRIAEWEINQGYFLV